MADDLLMRIDDAVSDWEACPESWVPGDPLHTDPRHHEGGDRQVVRPMVQLLDDRPLFAARCERCDVRWVGDDPCFACGQQVAGEELMRLPGARRAQITCTINIQPFMQAMREALAPLAGALLELAAALDQPDPPGRPRPLPIDGHEYARRRNRRSRR